MAGQNDVSTTSTRGGRLLDAFVVFAVTVISLALGAWLLLRLGLRLWSGLAIALAIYASLLSGHLMLRRRMAPKPKQPAEDVHFDPWENEPAGGLELPGMTLPSFDRQPAAADYAQLDPEAAQAVANSQANYEDPFAFRPAGGPSLATPPRAPAPAASATPPTLPSALPPTMPALPAAAAAAADASVAQGNAPELSVEMIQDLIKKLADELNTAPATPPKVRGKLVPQPAAEGDAMIGRSIAALEATAKSMRAATEGPRGAGAPAVARQTTPPAIPVQPKAAAAPAATVSPQLVRIAEAVASERMEVLLEPIQALAESRTRHFEVTTRLLAADGTAIDQDEILRHALGSGVMPRIDVARLVRAARVARRLGEGGRTGSVLSAAAAESLADRRFVGAATGETAGTNTRLVLSFMQSEVRIFSDGHSQALTALSGAGFRYALDGVTDLDMDFGQLKRMGFDFVKLDAPVFLEGLPAPGGHVPAADICRMLADEGLTLIVGRIEDDWLLARILGFGVLYGRGTLFGGPRLVKPEIVAGAGSSPNVA